MQDKLDSFSLVVKNSCALSEYGACATANQKPHYVKSMLYHVTKQRYIFNFRSCMVVYSAEMM